MRILVIDEPAILVDSPGAVELDQHRGAGVEGHAGLSEVLRELLDRCADRLARADGAGAVGLGELQLGVEQVGRVDAAVLDAVEAHTHSVQHTRQ